MVKLLSTVRATFKKFTFSPGTIGFSAEAVDRRLHRRLSTGEMLAILAGVFVLNLCLLAHAWRDHVPYDYYNYIRAVKGDFSHYYYAYWLLPLFIPFEKLPLYAGYYLWGLFNLAAAFFALRVFGNKPYAVLLSFQLFYVLYFGSITGIIIGALALQAWALSRQRWDLAGLGIVVAAAKFQMGLPLVLAIWLLADIHWQSRLRVLLIPGLVVVASLLFYPGWPLQSLANVLQNPPNDWGSISLWRWLGLLALLLWLPPLVLRLSASRRLILLACAGALAVPYFQQTDLLFLFALPVNGLALLGNLGYLYVVFGWAVLKWLFIAPLTIYLVVLLRPSPLGRKYQLFWSK